MQTWQATSFCVAGVAYSESAVGMASLKSANGFKSSRSFEGPLCPHVQNTQVYILNNTIISIVPSTMPFSGSPKASSRADSAAKEL